MAGNETALYQALLSVNKTAVTAILTDTLAESGSDQMGQVLMSALEKIGYGWETGSISLAQVYMAGVISEEIVKRILPGEQNTTDVSLPRVGAVVFLDHHALGIRIVSSLVRFKGYPLVDLGAGAGIEKIIRRVREEKIQILLVSVLMLPSALAVKQLQEEMAKELPGVKIVVGGAPFRLDAELWKKVGADKCGRTAGDIFGILEELKGELG